MHIKNNIYLLVFLFILVGCVNPDRIVTSVQGPEAEQGLNLYPSRNNCYDKKFSDLEELSAEIYDRFRLVGWGITSHRDLRPIEWFSKFLDQVGEDENLKYIFVEMPHVAKKTYEKMSISGIAANKDASAELGELNWFYLEPIVEKHQARYEYIHVIKKVAKLNVKRKNKIQVVPIDSFFGLNGETMYHPISWNRENHTMRNFMPYYKKMKPNEKGIFLYHTYHLARHIKGKSDFYEGNFLGESKDDYVSFLGQSKIKDSEFGLIVFDSPMQLDDGYNYFVRLFRDPGRDNKKLTSFHRLGDGANFGCLNGNNFFKASIRHKLRYEKNLSSIFNYLVYLGPNADDQ